MKTMINKRIALFTFVILTALSRKAFACLAYNPAPDMITYVGLAGFIAFLAFVSAGFKAGRDIALFLGPVMLVLMAAIFVDRDFYRILALEPVFKTYMFTVALAYAIRVFLKARHKGESKYYLLLLLAPVVIYLGIVLPPPFLIAGHGRCEMNMRKMGKLMDKYAASKGKYPAKLGDLEKAYPGDNYICRPQIVCELNDPKYKTYIKEYRFAEVPYSMEVSKDRKAYTIYCTSKNHLPFGRPLGYPQYSSENGSKTRP